MWADAVGSAHWPVRGDEGLQRGCLTHTRPCEVTSSPLPLPGDAGLKTAGGKSIRGLGLCRLLPQSEACCLWGGREKMAAGHPSPVILLPG